MGQQVIRHPASKLPNLLKDAKQGIQNLATGQTTYIVDPTTGDCQAIIGNLGFDNVGNATGLSGWGAATFVNGGWTKAGSPRTARGQVTINFGGTTSGNVTVTHGLGVVPEAAVAGSIQGNIGVNASFSCGNFTTTQMTIYGFAQSAPGGPFVISWIAML